MTRRIETLMWLGIFGAPVAWASTHVFGWGLSEANCDVVGRQWGIAFSTWEVAMTIFAASLAVVGIVSASIAYRAIRGTDKDQPGPEGRVWLLSISGLVVSPLMLVIILLTHIGALLLNHCHQS